MHKHLTNIAAEIRQRKILKINFGILLLGFAGSVLDSVLGAFVQARYGKEVAQDTGEGKPNKGFARVTNDVVNALSGLGIAGLAALIFYL